MKKITSFLILVLLSSINCGKVLFYIPVSGLSYLEVYKPLAAELASRGHKVTFVASQSLKDLDNVHQIVVNTPSFNSLTEDLSMLFVSNSSVWDRFKRLSKLYGSVIQVHSNAIANTQLTYGLRNDTFDLVVTSPMFNEMGVVLGDYFKIPTILFLPVNGEQMLSMALGYPDVPSWSGEGAVSTISNFRVQVINIIYHTVIKPYFFVNPQLEEFRKLL